ncbi:hypothetical protein ALC60_00981, partial [Trachymyrmex zeteki]
YALFTFVGVEIQSASVFVWSEIQSATLFHRAIVTLQLLELTSRGFAVRFIGEYLVRCVSIGEIVALRIRNVVFSTRRVDKQDTVREYFSMGRHANIDCFYLCQTYAMIPKHLIRDNANLLILQTGWYQLEHVYNDHVNTDMSYDEFCALCRDC